MEGTAIGGRVALLADRSRKRMQQLLDGTDLEEGGRRQEQADFTWLLAPLQCGRLVS